MLISYIVEEPYSIVSEIVQGRPIVYHLTYVSENNSSI